MAQNVNVIFDCPKCRAHTVTIAHEKEKDMVRCSKCKVAFPDASIPPAAKRPTKIMFARLRCPECGAGHRFCGPEGSAWPKCPRCGRGFTKADVTNMSFEDTPPSPSQTAVQAEPAPMPTTPAEALNALVNPPEIPGKKAVPVKAQTVDEYKAQIEAEGIVVGDKKDEEVEG